MLANRLRALLAERDLTIKDAMKATGISRSSFSNMVNNPYANISTDNVDKLCNFLSVSPSGFYDFIPWRFTYKFEPFSDEEGEYGKLLIIMRNGKIEKAFSLFFFVDTSPEFGNAKKHDATVYVESKDSEDNTFVSVYNESSPFFQHEIEKELNQVVATVIQLADNAGVFKNTMKNDLIVQFDYSSGATPVIQDEYVYHRNKPLKTKLEQNYQGTISTLISLWYRYSH